MRILIVVQARMTSTRLPGKVLKKVLGKPLLEYQLERLKRVSNVDDVVVATTTNLTDDPIVTLCNQLNVSSYRGSEEDVLSRYYESAQLFDADVVVRITSDCPLIDPMVVDQVIHAYCLASPAKDYVANCLERTYPRGMDTEVFSFRVLKQIHVQATSKADREHVTPYIYRHPEKYRIGHVRHCEDQSQHRWTVDTMEDFLLVKVMLENLYPTLPYFSMEDCLRLHEQNPEWIRINSNIKQKAYGET